LSVRAPYPVVVPKETQLAELESFATDVNVEGLEVQSLVVKAPFAEFGARCLPGMVENRLVAITRLRAAPWMI
jgi:hypothetical protein